MANNLRRVPFVLNLDDPVDAAIWEVLEPLLTRRRASAYIRGVVAKELGFQANPVPSAPVLGLMPGPIRQAKRPVHREVVEEVEPFNEEPTVDALDRAADNFLSMFG